MSILNTSIKTSILFILFLTFNFLLKAQPGIIGDGFSTGWNNPTDIISLSPSFGNSYLIILNPKIIGNPAFRLVSGNIELSPSANCIVGQDKTINNADIALLTAGSSNCSNSSWNIKSLGLTDNFIFKTNSTTIEEFFVARIAGAIQTITSVSHSPSNVLVGQEVTVTANLSGSFSTGQVAYLRYSRDGFITSSIVAMSDIGSVCTVSIPSSANSLGTIQYYVFTSGKGIPTSASSKADFFAINKNDNDGNYYSYSIGGGVTYTWNVNGNGDWRNADNWMPNRTTASTADILVFNNGAANTITNVPTETIGSLQISNNTIVNFQPSIASTLSINNGILGNDIIVSSGSQLNLNGSNALSIALISNATASISGSMTFSKAAHNIDAASAGAIVFNSGASLIQDDGFTGDIFTKTGTRNIAVFAAGSQFIQKVGGSPFGFTQPDSKVIFQKSSWYRFQANETPSFSGRTFANFEYNYNGNKNGSGSNIFLDTLLISSGALNINATGGVIIKGSIIISPGATLNFTPSSTGIFSLSSTTPQSISNLGSFIVGTNANLIVSSGSVVNLNSNFIVNGKLTNNGTLNMNNAIISGSGTTELKYNSTVSSSHSNGFNGSITTTTKSFSNDVNYVFTGSNAQQAGILTNIARSITLDKMVGNVSFNSYFTVSDTLIFKQANQGSINMGDKTLILENPLAASIVRLGDGYVIGKLQRAISESAIYNFPVGTALGYTPVSINFNGVSNNGSVIVQSNVGLHSNANSNTLSQTAYLNHWWKITNSGGSFSTAAVQFDYLNSDLKGGATASLLKLAQYNNSAWTTPSVATGVNSILVTSLTTFGDFMAAVPLPINDNSDKAILLKQNMSTSCNSPIDGTFFAATASNMSSSDCKNLNNPLDVWYQFTPQTPNPTITINGNTDLMLQILESNGTTSVDCSDVSTGNSEVLNAQNLVAGGLYFIRILPISNEIDLVKGSFNICINGEVPPSVASGSVGNCEDLRPILIQGTGTNEWFYITDNANNVVAAIKNEGNNLGMVQSKIYVHDKIRTSDGSKYMKRDVEMHPNNNQAAQIRLYYSAQDLADFGGSLSNVEILRIANGICSASSDFSGGEKINTVVVGSNYIEFSTSGFSRFYISSPATPLPVELVSFNGYTEGGKNLLTWVTASQKNVSHFSIERSPNGVKNWFEISKPIKAEGTTEEVKKYSETDLSPTPLAYYRLKMVDFDGSFQYSKVISIQKDDLKKSDFRVFPNPFNGNLNIQFSISKAQKVAFEIVNILGQHQQSAYFNTNEGVNNFNLNTEQLPKGAYFLKAEIDGQAWVERVVKR